MRSLKFLLAVLVVGAMPLCVAAQQFQQSASTLDQLLDRIVAREQAQTKMVQEYSPLVETYIQNLRPDKDLGPVPAGDKYFLGRAQLGNGVDLVRLGGKETGGVKNKLFGGIGNLFSMQMEFLPEGFLQMIYIDTDGFDRQHYQFDYVRREFLGDVRCLVFDVTPQQKSGKGRFTGRIWVEDQDDHIVRFNGAYSGGTKTSYYFHFDSWRVNIGANKWLPAFVYSEESDMRYAVSKKLMFKAQTRLWGYNLGHAKQEQELNKILVEAELPVKDQAEAANDLSPLQAQRTWDRQAEDNVVDRMERLGVLAPPGEVDKVLETVINNIEVTNNLNVQPEIRCRVLMTSTLEAFTIGHTIVMSRGLIDVLPDEASLATMLSHELGHVVLGHRIDTQYAFFDRLLFDDKETFRHWGFARTPEEEKAAMDKASELLKNSPYKDQLGAAQRFLQALANRSKEIPNLISPHLGDPVSTSWAVSSVAPVAQPATQPADGKPENLIVALPLGGRIKLDPWDDQLFMLKSKPVGAVAEREKMPFEITPFVLYLTRDSVASLQTPGAVSAQSSSTASPTRPE